jgi:hypothetical protein
MHHGSKSQLNDPILISTTVAFHLDPGLIDIILLESPQISISSHLTLLHHTNCFTNCLMADNMSFSTLVWDYSSSSSASPPVTSASISAPSTSATSPSTSPYDSSYQAQPELMSLEVVPKYSTPPETVDPADITTTPIHTPSAKKKKQAVLPKYPVYMREEDDWTKVKDPKEKKKIQNRVAQRTYRTSVLPTMPLKIVLFCGQNAAKRKALVTA